MKGIKLKTMPCALCGELLAINPLDYGTKVPICPICCDKAASGEIPIDEFRQKISDYAERYKIKSDVIENDL